jgi:glycosyltransferase involved in cell wall biosynthesis
VKVIMLLGPSTGGVGTHVAQLSADLRRRGVDVVVVTHPLTAEHFELGAVRLCWPGSAGMVHALGDFRLLRRLASTADIVHAHGHQGGLLATVATVTMPRRPKVIVSLHNAVLAGGGRQVLKRLSQRLVARRADLVTGASSDLVSEALAAGAGRAELAEVPSPRVPELLARRPADAATRSRTRQTLLSSLGLHPRPDANPEALAHANPEALEHAHPDPDSAAPLVVTISRIAPQKNLPVLVHAASLLGQRCTWVVIGDGDPRLMARLRQQVGMLGAPVHLVGARREVDQWLRAAEVFVLPSEWEARALVVQEAMAAGTPVVATDVGGLHDLVAGTGLLISPGDPEALAEATDRVLADPGLREDLATRGRQAASALPDGSDTVSRWLTWYSETARMT